MKKILVTGGNGFIGHHVVDNLLSKGYEVTVLDRFGKKTTWEGVNYFVGDIKDKEAVSDAISKHDGVINLAGILGTAEMISTPLDSIQVNICGAINVYEAIKRFEKKAVHITVGNYTWLNTYAITKFASERFALMYNKEFGTKIAVVRGLNVYGAWQKHKPVKKVVPNFILSALKDEPIVVYGDGDQLLDVIYAEDMAEVLVRALVLDHGVYNTVMEAGSGKLVTANELAKTIIRIAKSKSKLKHVPMRAGEPKKSITQGDPSTLAPLKYLPTTNLEEGLKRTIDWYRKYYKE